jgi:hypothetical protein
MPDWSATTPEAMRQLLDGVIAAAEREVPRVQGPPMTARRWAWHLVGQWYCAHHSIDLLGEVVERLRAIGRSDLAEYAAQKYDEEQGHDQFPLDDLRALGYDAEVVVRDVAPEPAIVALIEFARSCVRSEEPAEFLGYIYALERQMLRLSAEWFAALDAAFAPEAAPASFLRTHATDLDIEHVREGASFFAGLSGIDRTRIALGCYRTTQVRNDPQWGRYPSEDELQDRLSRFQTVDVRSGGPRDHPPEGEEL